MVPVAECNWPTVTSVSVMARPVVLMAEVAGAAARDSAGMPNSGREAKARARRRREGSSGALSKGVLPDIDDSSMDHDQGNRACATHAAARRVRAY
ncbi:hypothetical protein D3C73_658250 [compost metagenome]